MYPNQGGQYPGGYPGQQPQVGFGDQQPGYPPQGQQYPPPYPTNPGYPQQGGSPYPAAPGGSPYPPAGGGLPYPPSPFGQQQPQGYPAPTYPPQHQQGGYPGVGGAPPAYPQQAYPVQGQGYPPQQQAYPVQGQGYPPQQQHQPYPVQGQGQAPAYPGLGGGAPYGHGQGHAPGGLVVGAGGAMQQYADEPSIKAVQSDAQADAQVLRKAMKGFGTDEDAIIKVVTRRTDAQRQQIAQAFKASFGKDLIKDLKSELGGRLEEVILALMTPRMDYLAQRLHSAMSGLGTKESVLVDVLCSATNSEILQINQAYMRLYKRQLEKDLKGDLSGHFERLLISINMGQRNENPYVDEAAANDDAQKLLQAGEKKWGTDESMFNMILATRSFAHLRSMFHAYERLTGHSFDKAIQKEFSGDVERGMLAVVKCARNRAAYFAERLHSSMAGMGTKDNDLIFLMVSRADVDLGSVANEYQRMYGKTLANDISGDTSGDYKKVLLGLLGM